MGSGGVQAEGRFKWCFGTLPSGEGGNVTGSTGTGVRFYVGGLARENVFYLETDVVTTCSYQILSFRNPTGGTANVLSSGTMNTAATVVYHFTGPLAYVTPRIKTLNSTNGSVMVEYYGN